MTNISLDSLPAKTGTVSDAGIVHFRESGTDKKITISDLIAKFLANNPKLSSIEALSSIANILSLAGLNGSANKIPYFNGAGSMALVDLQPNQNAIINGDFNVWQRGTSFSSVANLTYTADRWIYAKSGVMVHDVISSTDVPTVAQAGRLISNSLKIDCTTIDSSIGSGDFNLLTQKIEGYNFVPLAQKAMTLSFWVKATKTGIYCAAFRGGNRAFVAEYTVNASNTWEFKTISILPSPASGSWDYTNGTGISVDFVLAVGSVYQTTANTWQTGNFFGTANQVNACDSTSNDFFIAAVQLEAGSVATPFEYRTIQQELFLCQRYYEFGYTYGTSYASSLSAVQRCIYPYKVNKRAPSPSGSVSVISGSLTNVSIVSISEYNVFLGFDSASAGLVGTFSVAISSEL